MLAVACCDEFDLDNVRRVLLTRFRSPRASALANPASRPTGNRYRERSERVLAGHLRVSFAGRSRTPRRPPKSRVEPAIGKPARSVSIRRTLAERIPSPGARGRDGAHPSRSDRASSRIALDVDADLPSARRCRGCQRGEQEVRRHDVYGAALPRLHARTAHRKLDWVAAVASHAGRCLDGEQMTPSEPPLRISESVLMPRRHMPGLSHADPVRRRRVGGRRAARVICCHVRLVRRAVEAVATCEPLIRRGEPAR